MKKKYNLLNHKFGINKDISWSKTREFNFNWWNTVAKPTKTQTATGEGYIGMVDPNEHPNHKKLNYDVFLQDVQIWLRNLPPEIMSHAQRANIEKPFASWFEGKTVGEISCGPYGGMLECYGVKCKKKFFIDIFMPDFVSMEYIKWPKNAVFVQAPAEHIHLEDNTLDVLLAYNSIDHGWDWKKSVDECLRVSKSMFMMFDTKDKIEDDFHPQKISHKDVLDYAIENDWGNKYRQVLIKPVRKDYGYYGTPDPSTGQNMWPETWIYVIK
mgnify:CR=1 FL=1|jgi:hypothetical protein